MNDDTLYNRIRDGKELTEAEQDDLYELLAKGCRGRRRAAIARALRYVPDIENYGIYSRVYVNDDGYGASYCAGQDYTSELKTVRELLAP